MTFSLSSTSSLRLFAELPISTLSRRKESILLALTIVRASGSHSSTSLSQRFSEAGDFTLLFCSLFVLCWVFLSLSVLLQTLDVVTFPSVRHFIWLRFRCFLVNQFNFNFLPSINFLHSISTFRTVWDKLTCTLPIKIEKFFHVCHQLLQHSISISALNFNFLHSITIFCTQFQPSAPFGINWLALCQSKSGNFSMYVITIGIKRNDFFMQRNASPINHTISWYLCLTLWLGAKALRFIIRFLKQKSFLFTKLCTTQLVCGTHQIKWLMSATHQLWVKYTVDLFHIYIYIRICSFTCLISQLPLVTDHYLFVCLFFSRQNSTANLCETLAIESEKITNLLSILIFMLRLNKLSWESPLT